MQTPSSQYKTRQAGRADWRGRTRSFSLRRDRGETFHFIQFTVEQRHSRPPLPSQSRPTPKTYTAVHERKVYCVSVNVAPEQLSALNPAWMGSVAEFPRMQLPSESDPDAFPGHGFRSADDEECKGH